MNSSKISLALATVATIISSNILPSHAAPSPSKGMVCPEGFKIQTLDNSTGARCVKSATVLIENSCPSQFPKLTFRDGRDVCTLDRVNPPSTGPLTGFNQGGDFVFSTPDSDAKRKAEQRLEQGFTLGRLTLPTRSSVINRRPVLLPVIPANQREAVFKFQKVIIDDGGTLDDHTVVLFDVFTFPIQKQ